MAKESTFYFSHDYNARNDRKIASLVKDYKATGYGIYWCTVEMMHEEGGELEFDDITFDAIAKDLNEANEVIIEVLQKCINKYNLLRLTENRITANRVKQNMNFSEAKRKTKKEAGQKGGINSGKSRRYKKEAKQNEAVLQNNEADEKKNEANEPNEMKLNEIKLKEEEKKERADSVLGLPPLPPPSEVVGYHYLPEGRSYIDREVFFTSSDFNGLPEEKTIAIVRLLSIVKKVETTNGEICELWEVFKTLNLTFQKPYRNQDDVYNHFSNWCKTQSFNKGTRAKSISKKEKAELNEKPTLNLQSVASRYD